MDWKNFAYWVMILVVIGMSIYVIRFFSTEGYACLSNPYNYSLVLLEKANGGEVRCLCTAYRDNNAVSVWLTKNGFEPVQTQVGSSTFQYPVLNPDAWKKTNLEENDSERIEPSGFNTT